MLTSREFAKMIGMSQATVSRALNNSPLVSAATKDYIQKQALECGFVLNSQARSLKTSQTGTIGILFPAFFESLSKNLMFTYIYDIVQKCLIENEYDVMVVYDYGSSKGLNTLERIVKSKKVDGFVNLRPVLSEKEIALIQQYQVPCVTMFNAPQADEKLAQFIVDEYDAGYQAGRFFGTQKDYQKMFISLPSDQENSLIRLRGFQKGLEEEEAYLTQMIPCQLSMGSAYQAVMENAQWFLEQKTASFVYNDVLAIGVVRALKELHIKIPEDAQVIGMDDIPMAVWLPPRLSTMQAPIREIVEDGCKMLCRLIGGEAPQQSVKMYCSALVHRDTTVS